MYKNSLVPVGDYYTPKTTTIKKKAWKKQSGKVQKGIQELFGDPSILLIAPHGVMGDDDRTDTVAFETQEHHGCHAIINKRIKRDDKDLNSKEFADDYPPFKSKLDMATSRPQFKLAVWIHGGDETGENWKGAIEASEFDCWPQAIDAFIGYGQGANPDCPDDEPDDRLTAKEKTADALCEHLTAAGIVAIKAGRESPSYRERKPDNMNQWLIEQGFTLDQAESLQIEIHKKGLRDSKKKLKRQGKCLPRPLKRSSRTLRRRRKS